LKRFPEKKLLVEKKQMDPLSLMEPRPDYSPETPLPLAEELPEIELVVVKTHCWMDWLPEKLKTVAELPETSPVGLLPAVV
jgi:hypothetical protein